MGIAVGVREVGYLDCPGGGQVVVKGNTAYVGNLTAPDGTLIVDVSDPRRPREIARLGMVAGTHSHKVRVAGDLMVINRERNPYQEGASADFRGGLGIFDVSTPNAPKLISNWETEGMGVHRFDFDGRYAYISPTVKGYLGNIVMILDLTDPARPVEVGRWWMPGQWTEGGEIPTWPRADNRCHHPLRLGNRLYTSYWFGGVVILDIEDMSKPKLVSSFDTSPPFPWPTHTALAIPFPVQNRRIMLVADEDVRRRFDSYPSLPLDGRHHRRDATTGFRELPGRGHRRDTPTRLHRLPSALRNRHWHRDSRGLVCVWSAHHRHRQSACAEGGCLVYARRAGGERPGAKQ